MSDEDDPQELPLEENFDAGDPAHVKRRETAQQIKDRESERFWKDIFSTETGRREMWLFLAMANPFEPSFACGPNGFPQPEATWFTAGQKALTLRIYQTWLNKFTELVMQMQRENDPRFMPPPKKQRKKAND